MVQVTISRKRHMIASINDIIVYIDGTELVRLSNGQVMEVSLEAGTYTVEAEYASEKVINFYPKKMRLESEQLAWVQGVSVNIIALEQPIYLEIGIRIYNLVLVGILFIPVLCILTLIGVVLPNIYGAIACIIFFFISLAVILYKLPNDKWCYIKETK